MPREPYLVVAGIVVLEIVYDKEIAGRKAPDITCPGTIGICAVDLVYPPVVCRVQCKLAGIIALFAEGFWPLIFS